MYLAYRDLKFKCGFFSLARSRVDEAITKRNLTKACSFNISPILPIHKQYYYKATPKMFYVSLTPPHYKIHDAVM